MKDFSENVWKNKTNDINLKRKINNKKDTTMGKKIYALCEKESDVVFGTFNTKKEATEMLNKYEASDKKVGCYTEDYYEVRLVG